VHSDVGPTDQSDENAEFRFGNFCLFSRSRELFCRGVPLDIGSRAFDVLYILLQSRGGVVRKSDIVSYVWPHTFVDESNLRFQVLSLRKVLGEDGGLVRNVPGRGYFLAADVSGPDLTAVPVEDFEAAPDLQVASLARLLWLTGVLRSTDRDA
jgi:DNA-binding winged helix-turn-helix (wHTH) protein